MSDQGEFPRHPGSAPGPALPGSQRQVVEVRWAGVPFRSFLVRILTAYGILGLFVMLMAVMLPCLIFGFLLLVLHGVSSAVRQVEISSSQSPAFIGVRPQTQDGYPSARSPGKELEVEMTVEAFMTAGGYLVVRGETTLPDTFFLRAEVIDVGRGIRSDEIVTEVHSGRFVFPPISGAYGMRLPTGLYRIEVIGDPEDQPAEVRVLIGGASGSLLRGDAVTRHQSVHRVRAMTSVENWAPAPPSEEAPAEGRGHREEES